MADESAGRPGGPGKPPPGASGQTGDPQTGGNLPLSAWVTAPLLATARGNAALAEATLDYVKRIALEDPDDPNSATRVLTFSVERKYKKPTEDGFGTETLTIKAPVLALLPIPSLLVDEVQIEFSTSISQIKSSSASGSKNDKGDNVPGKETDDTVLSGALSVQSEQTRKTDYRSTYSFRLRASQQDTPEGMSRLSDIMASVMMPTPEDKEQDR